MLKSSLCGYREGYILAKGTIKVAQETSTKPNNANKRVVAIY